MNRKTKTILTLVAVFMFTIGLVAYTQVSKPSPKPTELTVTGELMKMAQSPFAAKYTALLDSDLKLSIEKNKLTFTSKAGFDYIKFNGVNAPKNASMTLEVFNLKANIVKRGNVVTVQ